jgi:hypothetical protein
MTSLIKLSLISLLAIPVLASAGEHRRLHCLPAAKALPSVRSIVVSQTEGDLFGAIGKGVAFLQVRTTAGAKVHRIPVGSYYSKRWFINVSTDLESGHRTVFHLHADSPGLAGRAPETLSGEARLETLRFPVTCRYLD